MRNGGLQVRELAAWGFDASPYRPCADGEMARRRLEGRAAFVGMECLVAGEEFAERFAEQALRGDLLAEMEGLEWGLGVVDLRGLIAFQRRVVFDPACPRDAVPDDVFGVAFGAPVPLVYTRRHGAGGEVLIETANPNLQLRGMELHGGSPFFEVGSYRGRWFLRDGYHRAYALLRAGIVQVPAVVVRARTLKELGPVGEWFFAEEILFGERPPMVVDFLDDELTIEYTRPRLLKTIRIRVEESFAPMVEMANE